MFQINVDARTVLANLSDVQENQLPFAVSLALNRVANDAQAAERQKIRGRFHLRHETFVLNTIKIAKTDRATKSSWFVVISIPVDRNELAKFEEGGFKTATKGKWVWEPNKDVFGDVPIQSGNSLAVKNLHFARTPGGEMQGNERTFMIHGKKGPLILQRTDKSTKGVAQRINSGFKHGTKGREAGSGRFTLGEKLKGRAAQRKGGTRILYTLVQRVSLPIHLEFVDTISRTAYAQWLPRMTEAMDQALRGAR